MSAVTPESSFGWKLVGLLLEVTTGGDVSGGGGTPSLGCMLGEITGWVATTAIDLPWLSVVNC